MTIMRAAWWAWWGRIMLWLLLCLALIVTGGYRYHQQQIHICHKQGTAALKCD